MNSRSLIFLIFLLTWSLVHTFSIFGGSRPASKICARRYRYENTSKRTNKYSSPVGYQKGDMNAVQKVFDSNSFSGTMTLSAFRESRYLRFWPGSLTDLNNIWIEIAGGTDKGCTFEEFLRIHSAMDILSQSIEDDMAKERVAWQVEDVKFNTMALYFDRESVSSKISFEKFLNCEFVQAELWFHDSRALSEEKLAEMWADVAGSTSNSIDFKNFYSLYNRVCEVAYEA